MLMRDHSLAMQGDPRSHAERLELRDPGSKTVASIGELRAFSEVVSAAGVESGVVENTGRDPSVIARQIAAMSGWLASAR